MIAALFALIVVRMSFGLIGCVRRGVLICHPGGENLTFVRSREPYQFWFAISVGWFLVFILLSLVAVTIANVLST
jgi:hypothetical protein